MDDGLDPFVDIFGIVETTRDTAPEVGSTIGDSLSWLLNNPIYVNIQYLFWALVLGLVIWIAKIGTEIHELKMKGIFELPELAPDNNPLTPIVSVSHEWEQVVSHMQSESDSDWKVAILEADTILEQILESMELEGDHVGDKLKHLSRAEAPWLEDAWEAHKVRNRIAHGGFDFELSRDEAERTIAKFESVFRRQALL